MLQLKLKAFKVLFKQWAIEKGNFTRLVSIARAELEDSVKELETNPTSLTDVDKATLSIINYGLYMSRVGVGMDLGLVCFEGFWPKSSASIRSG